MVMMTSSAWRQRDSHGGLQRNHYGAKTTANNTNKIRLPNNENKQHILPVGLNWVEIVTINCCQKYAANNLN